jgi:Zn-dependent protease
LGLNYLFSNPVGFLRYLLVALPGIVIGISVHEFAHAWMANRLGDPTPRYQGRVTMSPFAHIEPMGLLLLFLFRFGYGKPVQINPANFKHRKRDEILVSIAGVSMNFLVALATAFLFILLLRVFRFYNETIFEILNVMIAININLIVFNLLPIPPLDGYKVVRSLFLHKNVNFFWKVEQYGYIILLVVMISGLLTPILVFFSEKIIALIVAIVGIFF